MLAKGGQMGNLLEQNCSGNEMICGYGRGCFFLTLWLSPFTLFLLGDLKGDWCV